jgi:oligopeptide/dipeptide ABC transporter ATP-binding protein
MHATRKRTIPSPEFNDATLSHVSMPMELTQHPRHAYARALLASIPSIKPKHELLHTIPGLPPNLANPPSGCAFRPRNTMGIASLCLTDSTPLLSEIAPQHFVQNCPGCLAFAEPTATTASVEHEKQLVETAY